MTITISRFVKVTLYRVGTSSQLNTKGNTPKFGPKVTHHPVDLSVGDIRSQIAAE